MFVSSFCCASIMTHLCISARVQMSYCLSLLRNGLSWVAKNGHLWQDHFRKLDLEGRQSFLLHTSHEDLLTLNRGPITSVPEEADCFSYSMCHEILWCHYCNGIWQWSRNCLISFISPYSAVLSYNREVNIPSKGAPSVPQDFIFFPLTYMYIHIKDVIRK